MFAEELISIWEHDWQVFIFETWRGSMGLQNGARDLWIFHSCSRCCFQQFLQIERFLGEKASKNGKEIEFQKSPALFWKQGGDKQICQIGAFQLSGLDIGSWERPKDMVWETASLYNFVQKPNSSEQLRWRLWFTFNGIWSHHTSIQSWTKWSDQNKDSSKKQFWPYSCALRNRR